MKKLSAILLAALTVFAANAELPLLVGHRGSSYGVENSVESFTNGAKLGYSYLETDFKVTKDKQLVCSHDDDLSRLGGSSLTIAGSTLEELQAVPFTQTRSGTTYTGRLCSAQEYLDVCKQYGVRPLIELKWATGINNNDQSNIPMLIKFIEDNGFRDKCIILTSMKPCLEYIRKNYPDIELQFLTGQYWASHFDWCVKWDIDVDIQTGYFDKTTVEKYHNEGLKVNMWTTNSNDGYKQYGDWGCDFITTDNLDPKSLPELDPSTLFPPNTTDYPRTEGNVKGFYTHEPQQPLSLPAELSGHSLKKALIDGDSWIILSFNSANEAKITRVNVLTGNIVESFSTEGIVKPGDIAMTADKKLIVSDTEKPNYARLLKWDTSASAPVEFFNGVISTPISANETIGSHIAVSGRSKEMKVYLSSETSATVSIVGLHFEKESLVETVNAPTTSLNISEWGDYSITVTPNSRNCFIIDSKTIAPVEYRFFWDSENKPLEVYEQQFPAGLMPDAAEGISFIRRAMKTYAVIPSVNESGAAYNATLYNITDGYSEAIPATAALTEGIGESAPQYAATAISEIGGKLYVHILAAPYGMVSVPLVTENVTVTPEKVDLELTRNWIFSESTSNKPENIDGTNAQQGTAVNGYFYINNCVEKKLHIFNSTGYLGSIPGGAGWGCARDDAGNILLRDDKLTGDTHSFIIYPAGATPDNYSEPVRFETTVKLAGQTNFINAGGDLLNGTGHIYLYPNKQNAVNIITVDKGKVIACQKVENLSLTGSTAGYVVPFNDDTDNWLYQIRNSGIYFNNGGINNAVSTSRASTTAPARNSTGGFAYFILAGNVILAHNSGANYVGGFTVRNLTTDAVVTSISPIGTMGYKTGGNYSTFNWLIPEKVSDHEFTLYQYCPANGLACYTLRNKLGSVDIIGSDSDRDCYVTVDANTLTFNGTEVSDLRIYDISGRTVTASHSNTADISALTKGIYIAVANGSISKKFIR